MRGINPAFHVSAQRNGNPRRVRPADLFAETSRAQQSLVIAEFHATELGLSPAIVRQLEVARGLLEDAHLAARLHYRAAPGEPGA